MTLFVKLALTTGGRLGTIINIQKKDIDLVNNSITLKDIKNNEHLDSHIRFKEEDLQVEFEKFYK